MFKRKNLFSHSTPVLSSVEPPPPPPPPPPPLSLTEQESALGLSLIAPRIFISCRPSSRGTDLADSRVSQVALSQFLNNRYTDSSTYALFNLSTKGRDSIDYTLFRNQVVEFPPVTRADLTDETPGLGEISRFIYSLKLWLTWDESTIAVLFCNTGVQRSCVFAALYQYYNNYNGDISALDRVFSIARIRESIGMAQLTLRPSWTTLIAFAEKEFRLSNPPSLPKPFSLSHVVVNLSVLKSFLFSKYKSQVDSASLPSSSSTTSTRSRNNRINHHSHSNDPNRQCLPIVQLFSGVKLAWDSEQAESEFYDGDGSSSSSSSSSEPPLRWDGDKLIISFLWKTEGFVLCGDFQLWLLLPRAQVAQPSSPRRGPSIGELTSSTSGGGIGGGGGGGMTSTPSTTPSLNASASVLSQSQLLQSSSSSSPSSSYSISEVDPSTTRTGGPSSVESLRGKRGFLSFPGGLSPLLRRVNASLRSVKGHTKKLNPVARLVSGMGVSEALAQLAFSASSRASAVSKVIERAIIKADLDHGLKRGDLVVEAAWTGKHVSYPRLRHHAKGRGGKSFKRTSQVSVSLREKVDDEKKKTKKVMRRGGEEVLNTTTLLGGLGGGDDVKLQVDVRGY